MPGCLGPEMIDRYRFGTLEVATELPAVEAHLESCAACQGLLEAAIRGAAPALLRRLAAPAEETGEDGCEPTDSSAGFFILLRPRGGCLLTRPLLPKDA